MLFFNFYNYEIELENEFKNVSENINEENYKSLSSYYFQSYENDLYLENIMIEMPKLKSYNKEELKNNLLSQIYNMNNLFSGCSSLKYLPNISKWNLKNTTDISLMFAGCTSLIYLPDISNWNTQNITDMYGLFYNCSSLKELPDISKWNINNVNALSGLFYGCSSLKELPDISKWNLCNVNYLNNLFFNCYSLISIIMK